MDNHFRLKEGGFFYVINGRHRFDTLRAISEVTDTEWIKMLLIVLRLALRDGQDFRPYGVVKISSVSTNRKKTVLKDKKLLEIMRRIVKYSIDL